MKKIFATMIGLAVGTTFLHAQGYLLFTDSGIGVTTNTAFSFVVGGSETGGTSGKTFANSTVSFAYDYAILYSTVNPGAGAAPTNADWSVVQVDNAGSPGGAILATNAAFGGLAGNGGANSVQLYNMANGTSYYVELVGWSANLGSLSQVLTDEATGNWTSGYFGYVQGTMNPNSATPGSQMGLSFPNNSLVLYAVPEPTTLALAGLGGMALLAFRRRNKKS